MYRTIIVPLDGSKRAEKILPHVEQLAKVFDSHLILMMAVAPMGYAIDPQSSHVEVSLEEAQWRLKEAQGYLDAVKLKLERKGLHASACAEIGPVVDTIIEVARKHGADLIAMASHGRTGLSRVLYGSVASGVLQRVNRPLLLIRSSDED